MEASPITTLNAANLLTKTINKINLNTFKHNFDSTFTGAVVTEDCEVIIAHLGDSPAYVIIFDPITINIHVRQLLAPHAPSEAWADRKFGRQRFGRAPQSVSPSGYGWLLIENPGRSLGFASVIVDQKHYSTCWHRSAYPQIGILLTIAEVYTKILPKEKLIRGKAHTYTIKSKSSQIRHYLTRFHRRKMLYKAALYGNILAIFAHQQAFH